MASGALFPALLQLRLLTSTDIFHCLCAALREYESEIETETPNHLYCISHFNSVIVMMNGLNLKAKFQQKSVPFGVKGSYPS